MSNLSSSTVHKTPYTSVRHGVNEEVLAFFDRRFGFRRILASGHPGISPPQIREEFVLIFREMINDAADIGER